MFAVRPLQRPNVGSAASVLSRHRNVNVDEMRMGIMLMMIMMMRRRRNAVRPAGRVVIGGDAQQQ